MAETGRGVSQGVSRAYLSRFTPGGAQTRSKRDLFPKPSVSVRSEGSIAYCENGKPTQPYIDWIAGLASVGLGYKHPEVDAAVMTQIRMYGSMHPLPTLLEAEVAETLCDALGWPDQVRWVKTGSEATDGAMLIARAATGRRKIVSIGYHGWHCAHLPGVELVTVPWNKNSFDDAIDCTTAAVLLEPMRDAEPHEFYLEDVMNHARKCGALVIMDEIVTGFRWAIGGATEYFNLDPPDLACYGKAMANGYPIAAIAGKRGLMKYASEVSSTFGGESVGLAAAKATIGVYQREPVIEKLWDVGAKLMAGLPELQGYAVHPHFPGQGQWGETSELTNKAAEKGVLMHPAGANPMYSHTDEEIETTVRVFREILDGDSHA